MKSNTQRAKIGLSVREMTVFAMLGALMFVSKLIMEWAPNIHFLGMLTMTYTLVYRRKALIPIYVYVFVQGAYAGFNTWWAPYLYLWTILWGLTMLLPKKMPTWLCAVVYPALCGLHGFAFGILYAPAEALFYGFDFKTTLLWISKGFYFDMLHGFGNIAAGFLILPLSRLMIRLENKANKNTQKPRTA